MLGRVTIHAIFMTIEYYALYYDKLTVYKLIHEINCILTWWISHQLI
jgi:hypothetical protein